MLLYLPFLFRELRKNGRNISYPRLTPIQRPPGAAPPIPAFFSKLLLITGEGPYNHVLHKKLGGRGGDGRPKPVAPDEGGTTKGEYTLVPPSNL